MRDEWDQMCEDVRKFQDALEELISVLPQSPAMYKRENAVKKGWEKFKKSWNNFDGFITPMKAVEVKEPWNDPEFQSNWKYWKEYLQEQHGVWIRSRSEVKALKQLKEYSDNNPAKAVKLLDHAMARRAANFYKVKDEDLETNNILNNGPEEKKPTVFKLNK
jgi:hypothetical protein